jgi:hypothetical protein
MLLFSCANFCWWYGFGWWTMWLFTDGTRSIGRVCVPRRQGAKQEKGPPIYEIVHPDIQLSACSWNSCSWAARPSEPWANTANTSRRGGRDAWLLMSHAELNLPSGGIAAFLPPATSYSTVVGVAPSVASWSPQRTAVPSRFAPRPRSLHTYIHYSILACSPAIRLNIRTILAVSLHCLTERGQASYEVFGRVQITQKEIRKKGTWCTFIVFNTLVFSFVYRQF